MIVVAALYLLRRVRALIVPRFRTDYGVLSLTFEDTGEDVSEVTRLLGRHAISVRGLDAEIEDKEAGYGIRIRVPPSRDVRGMLGETVALPGVKRVSLTGLHDPNGPR